MLRLHLLHARNVRLQSPSLIDIGEWCEGLTLRIHYLRRTFKLVKQRLTASQGAQTAKTPTRQPPHAQQTTHRGRPCPPQPIPRQRAHRFYQCFQTCLNRSFRVGKCKVVISGRKWEALSRRLRQGRMTLNPLTRRVVQYFLYGSQNTKSNSFLYT